jgi:phosphoglycerate dehydrogenase-like enzyme
MSSISSATSGGGPRASGGHTGKPHALFLFDPEEVPSDLDQDLSALVEPTWVPAGLSGIATVTDFDPASVTMLVTANETLDTTALARFPGLRWIVTTGTAYDYVDLDYCRSHGVTVSNTPNYTGAAVAEHAVALLLAQCRHIARLDRAVHEGTVDEVADVGIELAGKTAGIVGLGGIGRQIATRLQAFEIEVVFTSRRRKSLTGGRQVELDTLLREADFVFLTLPLNEETYHLLDRRRLALLKPTALIVNVSSDELIDPVALGEALRANCLGGAAFDVIGSAAPYVDLPRVTLTPTRGWYTHESITRRARSWITTIATALEGKPRHVVT